jgi:hypothetical protein
VINYPSLLEKIDFLVNPTDGSVPLLHQIFLQSKTYTASSMTMIRDQTNIRDRNFMRFDTFEVFPVLGLAAFYMPPPVLKLFLSAEVGREASIDLDPRITACMDASFSGRESSIEIITNVRNSAATYHKAYKQTVTRQFRRLDLPKALWPMLCGYCCYAPFFSYSPECATAMQNVDIWFPRRYKQFQHAK